MRDSLLNREDTFAGQISRFFRGLKNHPATSHQDLFMSVHAAREVMLFTGAFMEPSSTNAVSPKGRCSTKLSSMDPNASRAAQILVRHQSQTANCRRCLLPNLEGHYQLALRLHPPANASVCRPRDWCMVNSTSDWCMLHHYFSKSCAPSNHRLQPIIVMHPCGGVELR